MSNTERLNFGPAYPSFVHVPVDSANYMLGGASKIYSRLIHKPSASTNHNATKPQQSGAAVDMPVVYDHVEQTRLQQSFRWMDQAFWERASAIDDEVDATTTCARVISCHAFFCTCNVSCCCMCGTFCSLDCHACFHKPCAHVTTTVCQKDADVQPRAAVDTDKVSFN